MPLRWFHKKNFWTTLRYSIAVLGRVRSVVFTISSSKSATVGHGTELGGFFSDILTVKMPADSPALPRSGIINAIIAKCCPSESERDQCPGRLSIQESTILALYKKSWIGIINCMVY